MIAYLTAIATLVGVRALLTLGLNIQWGLTGLVNLGAVAFFAVGAYTSALLAVGGTPLVFAWPAAVGLATAAGAGLAMVALRLREDYLAIVTLGFGEVLRLFPLNETWLTRGANGVTAIPSPLHARFSGHYDLFYFVLVLVVVALVYSTLERLRRSPFGRVLRATREDEIVAAVAEKPGSGWAGFKARRTRCEWGSSAWATWGNRWRASCSRRASRSWSTTSGERRRPRSSNGARCGQSLRGTWPPSVMSSAHAFPAHRRCRP